MVEQGDLKEILELALDRELEDFEMTGNFYTDYGLDSMGAVAFFVELQRRTGREISLESAPLLQTGVAIAEFLRSSSLSQGAASPA